MRLIYSACAVGAVFILGGCAGSVPMYTGSINSVNAAPGKTAAAAEKLTPGMTRDQVTALMGQPQGFQSQPNGVECLTHTDRETSTVALTMTTGQDRLLVLKDGRLASNQTVQTSIAPNVGVVPGQATVAMECARVAAQIAPFGSSQD